MDTSPGSYIIPSLVALAHAGYLASRYDAFVTRNVSISDEPIWVAISCPLLYLIFVFVGKKVMAARSTAFEPTAAMFVYNVYETLLSFVMLVLLMRETVWQGINPFNAPVDRSPRGSVLAFAIWVNYQSK